jgi:hypothetical protein
MKRLLIALILACVTAGAAYAIFLRACPENKRFDCEIKWLSHKLALTPEQTERVRAAHLKYCPSMNGLGAQAKNCGEPNQKAELKQACGESTCKLIDAVCAELTPQQREVYLKLLEARKQKNTPQAQPPEPAK